MPFASTPRVRAEPPGPKSNSETVYYGVHSSELRSTPNELWQGGDIGWLTVVRKTLYQARAEGSYTYDMRWEPADTSGKAFPSPWGAKLSELIRVTYSFGGRHMKGDMYPAQVILTTRKKQVRLSFHNAEPVDGEPAAEAFIFQLTKLCEGFDTGTVFKRDGPYFATDMEQSAWSDRSVAAFKAARRQHQLERQQRQARMQEQRRLDELLQIGSIVGTKNSTLKYRDDSIVKKISTSRCGRLKGSPDR